MMESDAGARTGDLIAAGWTDDAAAWTQVNVSAPLIAQVSALDGGSFSVVSYETLARDASAVAGPWPQHVGKFSLRRDPLHPSTNLTLSLLLHGDAA